MQGADIERIVMHDLVQYLRDHGFPNATYTAPSPDPARSGPRWDAPEAVLFADLRGGLPTVPVVVEIGPYPEGGWPRHQAVLHVDLDGAVQLVNSSGHEFERLAERALRSLLDTQP